MAFKTEHSRFTLKLGINLVTVETDVKTEETGVRLLLILSVSVGWFMSVSNLVVLTCKNHIQDICFCHKSCLEFHKLVVLVSCAFV